MYVHSQFFDNYQTLILKSAGGGSYRFEWLRYGRISTGLYEKSSWELLRSVWYPFEEDCEPGCGHNAIVSNSTCAPASEASDRFPGSDDNTPIYRSSSSSLEDIEQALSCGIPWTRTSLPHGAMKIRVTTRRRLRLALYFIIDKHLNMR